MRECSRCARQEANGVIHTSVKPEHSRLASVYLDDPRLSKDWRDRSRERTSDDDVLLVKDFDAEIEILKERKSTVDGMTVRPRKYVLSTKRRDRDRDSIAVEGWDLDSYHKPRGFGPVLFGHMSFLPPIARGTAEVKGKRLIGVAEFPEEGYDEDADRILRMVDFKALNGCSVGFLPKKFVLNAEERGFDFSEQELVEWSIVNVGSNPDALIQARNLDIEVDWIAELAEKQIALMRGAGNWIGAERLDEIARALGYRKGTELVELSIGEIARKKEPEVKTEEKKTESEQPEEKSTDRTDEILAAIKSVSERLDSVEERLDDKSEPPAPIKSAEDMNDDDEFEVDPAELKDALAAFEESIVEPVKDSIQALTGRVV